MTLLAKFELPIHTDVNRLSPQHGICFGRYGPVWSEFFNTIQGFGIGIRDLGGKTVFGLVTDTVEEPVVLLTEEAVRALWHVLSNLLGKGDVTT